MPQDYNKTINLPKTDFPMRAALAKREPGMLEKMYEDDIYNKLMEKLGIVGGECTPDGKFSLDACRCVGACGLAPVMMVNDEVYGRLTVDDIDDILAKYE